MFRKPSNHPKTNPFDINKIEQHIATINFLADTLQISTSRHHLNSHLSVLRHAIQQFEHHRFADYMDNNTERAMQVLHTRQIYKELYKHQLKKSDSSIIAKALKDELRDYATSVKGMVSEIGYDLADALQDNHDEAMENQSWDLMNQELNHIQRDAQAYYLAARVAEIESPESDDSNDISSDDATYEPSSYESEEFTSDSASSSPSSHRLFRLSTSSGSYSNQVTDSEETFDDIFQTSPRNSR